MTRQYVLHVFRAQSGQMSGQLYVGDLEICAVAGCATVAEVRQAIEQTGQRVDFVIDAKTGESLQSQKTV